MSELSPVKRALLEQRRLKARIEELERGRNSPIAVVGLGCRFPGGASGPAALWRLLSQGGDAIGEIPPSRWDLASVYDPDPEAPGKIATRFGGFLDGIDQFDPHVFGISPREAATIDPQQRLLLEVTWEALEHAGWPPDRLAGSRTGVFVGISTMDYFQRYAQSGRFDDIDPYLATGSAHSVASGRISYLLGLHGPSLSIDTACSSSLVAIHLACQSIRSGACDAAVAGGAGVMLALENFVSLSKARMMAADGRCKTFDASADGFVRSEGCGIVVLKRLADAQEDGDRILAVVRGIACNQDGRSNGITAPNGPAQQAVIRAALADAGVDPTTPSYVETHGTGTVLGDPIEVQSLAAVLGEGRSQAQPLLIGSIKSNLGHLEAAAGVAGFMKTVLALHHRTIPANLHFQKPNPHIAWDSYPYLGVPTAQTPWRTDGKARVAGVSAFGFSGTNAHLILEEAPETARPAAGERPVHLLALSGKTAAALAASAADLVRHVQAGGQTAADVCHSVNTGRAALPHRALVAASTLEEMRSRLERVAEGGVAAGVLHGVAVEGVTPRVLFVFAADAAADAAAVRRLADTEPTFARALAECGAAPPLFALQYALATLWRSWGVAPAAVLGAGVGEIAAAVIAGVLRLEDAVRLLAGGPQAALDPANVASPRMPFFSAALGRRVAPDELAAVAYWTRGLARSDRAGAARAAAVEDGFTEVLELGPALLDWKVIAPVLGKLYVGGVSVDWRGFDRDRGCKRVDVPASPWMRQRYWFEEAPAGAGGPADPQATWTAVTRAAEKQAAQIGIDADLGRFATMWAELDAFTTSAIAETVSGLGLFTAAGAALTVDGALAASGIRPIYRHLLSLWLKRLVRAGALRQRGDEFVAEAPLVAGPATLGAASDTAPLLRDYLLRCRSQMAAIVTGRQGPLETLFPGGSFETTDFFYRDWSLARYYNGIIVAIVDSLARSAGGRPLRVLEIGAGTGGTTSSLVPALDGATAEYWFTDVSEHFFGRAEQTYGKYPFVRFQKFDLDRDPAEQGIPTGRFDLVVAANAVHATTDLRRSIARARSLLAPGGLLLLYEVTTQLDWFDMSIALIEGWQHFNDDLRGETPLVAPAAWQRALGEAGFERVGVFPPAGSPANILGHHIIVAAAPGVAVRQAAVAPVATPVAPAAPRSAPLAAAAPTAAAAPSPAGAPSASPLRDQLAALTPGERRDSLRKLVQRQVMRVMRLTDVATAPGATDQLMNAGIDSLMAIELKKQLTRELAGAVELPATLIFDFPTIAAIADHIGKKLGFEAAPAQPAAPPVAAPAPATAPNVAALAALSDSDVQALLAEQLKGFQK